MRFQTRRATPWRSFLKSAWRTPPAVPAAFSSKPCAGFWQQYQRIDKACAWVLKILKPDNGEMYLAEMTPNVEAALAFRRRQNFDNKRKLMIAVAERHLYSPIADPIVRNIMTLMFCRTIIPVCATELNFRKLTGTIRAFPDFVKIFGHKMPIQIYSNRKWLHSTRCLPRIKNTRNL